MKKHEKDIQNELKSLIDNEEIQVPEGLSDKNMESLLKSVKQANKKGKVLKTIISVAAAAAVIAVSVTVGLKYISSAPVKQVAISGKSNSNYGTAPIKDITDYKELEDYFLNIREQYQKENLKDKVNSLFSGGTKDEIVEIAPENNMNQAGSSTGSTVTQDFSSSASSQKNSFGTTNIQVDGIDEADIIKNDGEYLYAVSLTAQKLFIVKAYPADKMEIVSEIEFKTNYRIDEIYLNGDKLVTIGEYCESNSGVSGDTLNGTAEIYCGARQNGKTVITVIDVSDKTLPKEEKEIMLDGTIVSSRITGDKIVAASMYSVAVYDDTDTLKKKCIPSYYENGKNSFVPFQNIKILDSEKNQQSYLVIGIVDLADLSSETQVTAVLGGGEDCYCDGQNIYFSNTIYSSGTDAVSEDGTTVSHTVGSISTGIFMFDITGDTAQYKAYGEVDGSVDDQFSMDKNDEYFRIATTDNQNGSLITVMNENLETVGKISGLYKGESIYAVRFIGDTAYVVTFRQTDPLLVIDLSDPANPTLKGELKLPGFSDYLHPYSENLLIGIGSDGTQNGTNGKLKVSLFDVSNPENPKEVSKAIFDGITVTSPATYNHKAFLELPDTKEFAIPITKNDAYTSIISYLSVMTVDENNKLQITGSYSEKSADDASGILRGTYIGGTIYTFSNNRITAFNKASEVEISSVDLGQITQNESGTVVNEYNDTVY